MYFSDPLVIRYGKQELLSDKTSNNHDVESQDVELGETLTSIEESRVIGQKKNDVNIPCPVLEFRLVNRLHDVEEGEIGENIDCRYTFQSLVHQLRFLTSFTLISLVSQWKLS